ncbi:MAG TPA: DUF3775 domain-containing protein [Stellaceae bacterium]|nr:DUF3775 domain-containing protein [Stellaceae bacterium]
MLQHLSLAQASAVAAAALRVARDERAMVEYLGIGRRRGARAPLSPPSIVVASDPRAFEGAERAALETLLREFSPEARRELIALVWLGRSVELDFAAALRRARRIPEAAQVSYLLGVPLERRIPAALAKLGLKV